MALFFVFFFFFQAEDGIRDPLVTGVQTCALPILRSWAATAPEASMRLTNATWLDACESSAGSTALAGALRAPAMATDRCAAPGWAAVAAAGASLPAWRMSRRSSDGG